MKYVKHMPIRFQTNILLLQHFQKKSLIGNVDSQVIYFISLPMQILATLLIPMQAIGFIYCK